MFLQTKGVTTDNEQDVSSNEREVVQEKMDLIMKEVCEVIASLRATQMDVLKDESSLADFTRCVLNQYGEINFGVQDQDFAKVLNGIRLMAEELLSRKNLTII